MTSVAIVVFDGVQSLDISGPLDAFAEANRFLLPQHRYRLSTISIDHASVKCSNGMVLRADHTWRSAELQFDLLLVAGGPALVEQEFGTDVLHWLTQMCSKAARYGSICSGAFVLARAGLLEARKATTHWNYAAALAVLCPGSIVEADCIHVQDGPLYTSAGVTAGIDLALHLMREDHGVELARNVAKRLVVVMQRAGGQSQFSPYLDTFADPTSPMAEVQQHILRHLRADLSVGELAVVANMSVRGFSRVFSREVGMAPAEFVQRARVDAARAMLENSDAPLKVIAYDCGFGDAGRMRNAFVRSFGVSPGQYRMTFGARVSGAAKAG